MNLRQMSNGRLFLDVNAVGPRLYGHAPQLLGSVAGASAIAAGPAPAPAGPEAPVDSEELEAAAEENKDLFDALRKALSGKVKDVKANPTLQDHPVSLSSEGGLSMEMEKVLRKMPNNAEGMESTKILELNPNHAVFAALKEAQAAGDAAKIGQYAELLYDQALLIEGLPIEDPVAYAQKVCQLMK